MKNVFVARRGRDAPLRFNDIALRQMVTTISSTGVALISILTIIPAVSAEVVTVAQPTPTRSPNVATPEEDLANGGRENSPVSDSFTSDSIARKFIADPRTWISCAALLFSLLSFLFLYLERRGSRRVDVTLKMYDQWTNQSMQTRRSNVWADLNTTEDAGAKTKWSDLRKRPIWGDYGAIDHFISDLNALLDRGLVDKVLAQQLFGSTLLRYLERFENLLDFDLDEERHWFTERMLPIRNHFE